MAAPSPSTSRKSEKLNASDLEKGLDLGAEHWRDQRKKRKIQRRELSRVVTFFISANIVMGFVVVLMVLLEHFWPPTTKVITEKVLIAAIAGITLQAGAIILAAFKGLFSASSPSSRSR